VIWEQVDRAGKASWHHALVPPAVTPASLYLIIGEEELLVERAVRAAATAVRLADPDVELRRVPAAQLTAAELAELASPSLFAESRVVVLDAVHEAGKDTADAIADYLREPIDGLTVVLVHNGGSRAKPLLDAARAAGAAVTECPKITRPSDREAFIRDEVRRLGGKAAPAAVSALVETVGSDLRELAAAAGQLVADTGGAVTEQTVRRYHRGKAEVTGFVVAEKAVTGDRSAALEALRWAMLLGVPHVLVADALADAVRTMARVSGVSQTGGDPHRIAQQLGMPPWKVRKALGQSRGWRPAALAEAMSVVAEVNADVKGVAADADYALQRAVLRICAARTGH
jgi:DNA polymerase III subunit delta